MKASKVIQYYLMGLLSKTEAQRMLKKLWI